MGKVETVNRFQKKQGEKSILQNRFQRKQGIILRKDLIERKRFP